MRFKRNEDFLFNFKPDGYFYINLSSGKVSDILDWEYSPGRMLVLMKGSSGWNYLCKIEKTQSDEQYLVVAVLPEWVYNLEIAVDTIRSEGFNEYCKEYMKQ